MFPNPFAPIPSLTVVGGQIFNKFTKYVFPISTGTEVPKIATATGLHVDYRAIPANTDVERYLANTCPETAAFTLRNNGATEDHAVITVQRLPSIEDEKLWKSRVETYMTYKDVGLGIEYYWIVDCSNVDFGGFYGSGVIGITLSLLPKGYSTTPLPQFVVSGLANPTNYFTPSYIWNKSWRWGMAEERFMAASKALVLLRNITTTKKVPCRIYAGGIGVLHRNRDGNIMSSVLLPICSMPATISPSAAKEWADDAARAIWSDIVLGIQMETGTTSYRPHRLSVLWKLGIFAAGAGVGWIGGTLLSSYLMQTPEVAAQAAQEQKVGKAMSESMDKVIAESRPRPVQMDKPPSAMQQTQPIACDNPPATPTQPELPTVPKVAEPVAPPMPKAVEPVVPKVETIIPQATPTVEPPPINYNGPLPIEYAQPTPMQLAWQNAWKEALKQGKLQEYLTAHPYPAMV